MGFSDRIILQKLLQPLPGSTLIPRQAIDYLTELIEGG